jgi:hypothetical protein
MEKNNKNNTGKNNSGHYNFGDYNSGDRNSGNCNSGDSNTGDHNSGHCNSGHFNSGNFNFGNSNTGSYNSGNSNSGNFNSSKFGYRNFFCTENKYFLFDKEVTQETIKKLNKIYPYRWFNLEDKTYHEIWKNCPEETLNYLKSLPEFQTKEAVEKFKTITGIDLKSEPKITTSKTEIIKNALSKLTNEEKKALGLI